MLSRAQPGTPVVIAESHFATTTDGWTTAYTDGSTFAPAVSFFTSGGNPGGYIYATDDTVIQQWYWIAPAKFRGNISAAYGSALRFDLKQSRMAGPVRNHDVILAGAGITLVYDFNTYPALEWTRYAIDLTPTSGWKRVDTDKPPTAAEMQEVLSAVSRLNIRGDYVSEASVGALDNVVLGAPLLQRTFLPLIQR